MTIGGVSSDEVTSGRLRSSGIGMQGRKSRHQAGLELCPTCPQFYPSLQGCS